MKKASKEKLITSVQKKKRETKGAKKKLLLTEVAQHLQRELGQSPSLNEAIIAAAESFLHDLRLSPHQRSQIEQAASIAHLTPLQVLGKACDWAERFYGSKYAGGGEFPPGASEKALGTPRKGLKKKDEFTPGSAYQRIQEFVEGLMKKNDESKRKEDKVFINQTYLTKHQGANRDAIRGFLYANREILEKHHKKHELSPRHNVEVHSYRKRGLHQHKGAKGQGHAKNHD